MPVDVQPRSDLVSEVSYGNHSGVDYHQDHLCKKVRLDVMNGRVLVLDVGQIFDNKLFHVCHLGVVVDPAFRIEHDPIFSPRRAPHTSVNATLTFCRHRRVT